MRALSIRQPYAELIQFDRLTAGCGRSSPFGSAQGRRSSLVRLRSPQVGRGSSTGRQAHSGQAQGRPTKIIGERFYIYASRQWASGKLFLEGCRRKVQSDECRLQNEDRKVITSDNLEVVSAMPEPWMMELARMLILKDLPTGVIVGSAVITECRSQKGSTLLTAGAECRTAESETSDSSLLSTSNHQPSTLFEWHLADVQRVKRLRKPTGQPPLD